MLRGLIGVFKVWRLSCKWIHSFHVLEGIGNCFWMVGRKWVFSFNFLKGIDNWLRCFERIYELWRKRFELEIFFCLFLFFVAVKLKKGFDDRWCELSWILHLFSVLQCFGRTQIISFDKSRIFFQLGSSSVFNS